MIMRKTAKESLRIIDLIFWTDYHVKLQNHLMGFHDPSYKFEKSEIAFVHIPKTGGTSLHKLLSKDEQSRFVGLNMHRPISRLCRPSEYSYITVMRNPVDRVWSYYQMVLRNPPGFPYKRFADQGLECFLHHCWETRNMACRYYSGEVKQEPDAKILDIALDLLKSFICIIDFDNFQREVTEFLAKHNIPVSLIPHERKNSFNPCSQSDQALICKYNIYDLEIYSKWKEQSIRC